MLKQDPAFWVAPVALVSLLFTACAPAAIPAPVFVTTPTLSSQVSSSLPVGDSTATPAPSATATAAAAVTSTRAPATPAKPVVITVATLAAGNPSGSAAQVAATAIRLDPLQPVSGPNPVTFYVAFNNSSGKTQTLKWIVKIWSPDNSAQSFGQTAAQINDVPPGLSEIASAANWQTNPIACQPFYARVYSINTDNTPDPLEFKKPDGSPGPLQNFQVCPATPTK